MSGQKISCSMLPSWRQERLETHLADHRLHHICPVQAVQTVGAEHAFLLQDHSRSLHCFLLGLIFNDFCQAVPEAVKGLLDVTSDTPSSFIPRSSRLGMKVVVRFSQEIVLCSRFAIISTIQRASAYMVLVSV